MCIFIPHIEDNKEVEQRSASRGSDDGYLL